MLSASGLARQVRVTVAGDLGCELAIDFMAEWRDGSLGPRMGTSELFTRSADRGRDFGGGAAARYEFFRSQEDWLRPQSESSARFARRREARTFYAVRHLCYQTNLVSHCTDL
jgi:hypothetical protein